MPSGTITALEVQKRNKQRVNVYLDEEYAFALPLDEAAKLRKGQTLTEQDVEALQAQDDLQRAVDRAAGFLSYRPRSAHEVRQNLAQKGVDGVVIDQAMARLEALGYLDDAAFAAFWVRERNAFKPLSPRALRYELRQKGVPDAIIDEALADLVPDDAAYKAAESQARRLRGSTPRAFRDKLLPFLQRRGFTYGVAKTAIQRLIETLEAQGDYFADDEEAARDLILPDSDD
jgi:regulatory protein